MGERSECNYASAADRDPLATLTVLSTGRKSRPQCSTPTNRSPAETGRCLRRFHRSMIAPIYVYTTGVRYSVIIWEKMRPPTTDNIDGVASGLPEDHQIDRA